MGALVERIRYTHQDLVLEFELGFACDILDMGNDDGCDDWSGGDGFDLLELRGFTDRNVFESSLMIWERICKYLVYLTKKKWRN